MAKNLLFLLPLFLCACAGNPPQWWNPSGSYAAEQKERAASVQERASAASAKAEQEEPLPLEQSIEPAMDAYEELDLSPFAQVTDSEEEGAVLSEQPPAQPDPSPAVAQTPAPVEENLPKDGSLPAPSVLQ